MDRGFRGRRRGSDRSELVETPQDPEPMSRGAALAYAISLPLSLLLLLFLPAGRLDWRAGWLFVAVLILGFGVSALVLARVNPVI